MKRFVTTIAAFLTIVAGCAPTYETEEEIVQENEEQQNETAIVPKVNISDDYYRVILPYKQGKGEGVIYEPSAARGVIVNQMANRFDIDEIETGLQRHATTYFSTNQYYFQEGQYLSANVIYDWLGRSMSDKQAEEYIKKNQNVKKENLQIGLNPPLEDDKDVEAYREAPRYLSHILEHNYLSRTDENKVVLGGLSIALALKSSYRFQLEAGPDYYYEPIGTDEMVREGKQMAQTILERVRNMQSLQDIPVMIALYREQSHSSLVPGNFVAKTYVSAGDMTIDEWETVNEKYVLFPSKTAEREHYEDAVNVEDFKREVTKYFPNYIGVIGKGFYIDDELRQLKINIPIEFQGKAEVVGFTQYAYGLLVDIFPNYYDIEVTIESTEKQEALITRDAGEDEPFVYIYQ
ncbi:CamS family sex pheromone protein [Salirhabdus salicampi]|uniref:CamS family sex pheromone protein n=1 Tax=Salirhabdus salicampi TaxID=476102 RepID=UPI0020C47888|nr:CamS family sex pheromone protein [Salirhabdus salicampi]MCP8617856.1 CamS family sex pheromone protein [Salirhabdus salicampi]